MSAKLIRVLNESERRTWSYGSNHTNGAVRLFSVSDLIAHSDAGIYLWEWRGVDLSKKDDEFPNYAAISHSWQHSPEAISIREAANRPLYIDIGEDSPYEISWHGLRQAALAARHLGCELLWLDFICLDQKSSADKKLQIQNMGHIYENASAVIIMPGGVSAAQDVEKEAPWITRSWTLQEATLCPNTHLLALCSLGSWVNDTRYEVGVFTADPGPGVNIFDYIEGELGLANIRGLATGPLSRIRITHFDKVTGEVVNKKVWSIRCLGDGADTWAFTAVLIARSPVMKRVGVWRSMWLRTSKYPQDAVFSVMHLLGVHLEVDYSRNREDLIMEVAQKAPAPPSWLDIGRDMPFDPQQGLFPAIPPFHPHQAPAYIVGDQRVSIRDYIPINEYIDPIHIKILTPPTGPRNGDLVCAEIFDVYRDLLNVTPRLDGYELWADFYRPDVHGSHIMILGPVKHIINDNWHMPGLYTYHLRRSDSGYWECLPGLSTLLEHFKGKVRSHLRIGGSPGAEITRCNCESNWAVVQYRPPHFAIYLSLIQYLSCGS